MTQAEVANVVAAVRGVENEMEGRATKIAIATVLVSAALIGSGPASAKHGPHSLTLAPGHERAATHARGKQSYDYDRVPLDTQGRGDQWDPWGHWGSYYGPMIR
jgi:hypothetical protein